MSQSQKEQPLQLIQHSHQGKKSLDSKQICDIDLDSEEKSKQNCNQKVIRTILGLVIGSSIGRLMSLWLSKWFQDNLKSKLIFQFLLPLSYSLIFGYVFRNFEIKFQKRKKKEMDLKEAEELFGLNDYKQKEDDKDYTLEDVEAIFQKYNIFVHQKKLKTQNTKLIGKKILDYLSKAKEIIIIAKGWNK